MRILVSARLQATAAPEAPEPMMRTSTFSSTSRLPVVPGGLGAAGLVEIERGLGRAARRGPSRIHPALAPCHSTQRLVDEGEAVGGGGGGARGSAAHEGGAAGMGEAAGGEEGGEGGCGNDVGAQEPAGVVVNEMVQEGLGGLWVGGDDGADLVAAAEAAEGGEAGLGVVAFEDHGLADGEERGEDVGAIGAGGVAVESGEGGEVCRGGGADGGVGRGAWGGEALVLADGALAGEAEFFVEGEAGGGGVEFDADGAESVKYVFGDPPAEACALGFRADDDHAEAGGGGALGPAHGGGGECAVLCGDVAEAEVEDEAPVLGAVRPGDGPGHGFGLVQVVGEHGAEDEGCVGGHARLSWCARET